MFQPATVGLAFLEGLTVFVSPCILPVLPIILSTAASGGRSRPIGVIVGFILCFTLFTVFARQLVLAFGLDSEILRQVSFGLLLLFGVVLLSTTLSDKFAALTQGLSGLGDRLSRQGTQKQGFISGFLLGCCIGLVWVPCVGPILASVIVQSIQQHTTLNSLLTVLAFAIGAGVPMLLFALGGNRLMNNLQFFKAHSHAVRKVLGVVIILTVIFTAQDTLLPLFSLGRTKPTAAATQLVGGLSKPYPAPEITGIHSWINSPPLRMASLKGKVVLVDFWTYSCINCLRTLPTITAWDKEYRDKGLVIIGVHSPEFEFEKKLENVQRAVKDHHIEYPVALDNLYGTWNNFNNNAWPAHYLIDKNGNVVYTHFGEGDYTVTENNIRYLLGLKAGTAKSSDNSESYNSLQSPETYLGFERTENFASPGGQRQHKAYHYTFPSFLAVNNWALSGAWKADRQNIEATQTGAALRYNFYAKKVFLVLGTASNAPVKVTVMLNGKPVGKAHGNSVSATGELTVVNHTLYELINLPKAENGLLELQAHAPSLEAYAFTFGS